MFSLNATQISLDKSVCKSISENVVLKVVCSVTLCSWQVRTFSQVFVTVMHIDLIQELLYYRNTGNFLKCLP